LFVLIIALVLIYTSFRKLSTNVDAEKIEVSNGAVRKTISWNDVVSCEPTRARLVVYSGVGIRLGIDKSLAFTTSGGNAVKIVRKSGLPFAFSTDSPEKLRLNK
jgi:hypothetical protein